MRATEQALQSIGHPVTAAELAKRSSPAPKPKTSRNSRKPWPSWAAPTKTPGSSKRNGVATFVSRQNRVMLATGMSQLHRMPEHPSLSPRFSSCAEERVRWLRSVREVESTQSGRELLGLQSRNQDRLAASAAPVTAGSHTSIRFRLPRSRVLPWTLRYQHADARNSLSDQGILPSCLQVGITGYQGR